MTLSVSHVFSISVEFNLEHTMLSVSHVFTFSVELVSFTCETVGTYFYTYFIMPLFFFYQGIRVQSLKKGQITMDIDLRWGGDPSIILAVEALVASLPIQVFLPLNSFSHLSLVDNISSEPLSVGFNSIKTSVYGGSL